MLTNKKSLISWTFVCSLFISFLTIFCVQLGIVQIVIILFYLLLCIALYWSFNKFSNLISLLAKTESDKPKRIQKPETVFYIRLFFGVLFAALLVNPLTIVFTVIHELAHAATALILGAQVSGIGFDFSRPGVGIVGMTTLPSNFSNSLVSIAGSLAVILSAIVLLILIWRSKSFKPSVFISIFYAIFHNVTGNIDYWYRSVFMEVGDAWSFLGYNPQIESLLFAQLCEIIFNISVIFLLSIFTIKMALFFLKIYFPELSFGKPIKLFRKN